MAPPTYMTLPSGQKMPAFGLGTFDIRTDEETEQALTTALENGYRLIDTAVVYENEVPIGKALNKLLSSGKFKREELFITTKLPIYGVHPDRVEMFIKQSLSNLQLDYVDLYLIHFPVGAKYNDGTGFTATVLNDKGETETEDRTDQAGLWKKMEEQVDAGRAKNIGLSNYNVSQIETILKTARIKPAALQVELHIYLQQRELVDFCHKNGISVIAYSPLGTPKFSDFLRRIGLEPKESPDVLGNPLIVKLAEKYKKSPANIALKFLLQRNIAVIPKSVIPGRIEQNIKVFDFSLSDSEMKEFGKFEMGEQGRICDWKLYKGLETHPDFPFPTSSGDVCRR